MMFSSIRMSTWNATNEISLLLRWTPSNTRLHVKYWNWYWNEWLREVPLPLMVHVDLLRKRYCENTYELTLIFVKLYLMIANVISILCLLMGKSNWFLAKIILDLIISYWYDVGSKSLSYVYDTRLSCNWNVLCAIIDDYL